MSTKQLLNQNDSLEGLNRDSDALLERIGRIKAGLGEIREMSEDMPDLEGLAEQVVGIADNLHRALTSYESLPGQADLEGLADKASELAGNLEAALQAHDRLTD